MLNANAAFVSSARGDGIHGLLILTVSDAVYRTTTGMNFIPQTNPGTHPVIPTNATAAQIAHATREHNANVTEWTQYLATDNALRQQLFTAVPEIYLSTLRNAVTGFARITTKEALNHLYAVYGRISPHEYEHNDKIMKMAYDVNEPFELFVKQIEDAVRLADAAGKPYLPEQVEQIGYMLLERTGVFTDECKLWRRRAVANKNWNQMKLYFSEAHRDLIEAGQTAGESGYDNTANLIPPVTPTEEDAFQRDTAMALSNLAAATEADRSTLQEMAAANSALTNQLAAVTASLQQALTELAKLRLSDSPNPPRPADRRPPKERTVRKYNNDNYCWSCGFVLSLIHI